MDLDQLSSCLTRGKLWLQTYVKCIDKRLDVHKSKTKGLDAKSYYKADLIDN